MCLFIDKFLYYNIFYYYIISQINKTSYAN